MTTPAPAAIAGQPDPVAAGSTKPSRLAMARGGLVVSGGPLALAAWSVLAPVSAVRRWPSRCRSGTPRRIVGAATVVGLGLPWVYGLAVRPWLVRWGSTAEERAQRYPGDPPGPPLIEATRAVTVHAPATEVWRWLVQIGQDRGGFYSYDWLENLAGCGLHSADEVREDLQELHAGDALSIFPGISTRFTAVDPPRSLVIEGWGSYTIVPVDDATCRLVARSHASGGAALLVAHLLLMELPHAIMERKMLLGIKARAERSAPPTRTVA